MGRGNVDIGALASMVQRPGIDPREWVYWAVVTDLGFDPNEGHFAEIRPVPSGAAHTVYIGTAYAGRNFGTNFPVEKGDTVLVCNPGGDTGNGACIVAKRWDRSDPPPSETDGGNEEPTADVVMKIKPGQRIVIIVDGDGADHVVDLRGGAKALIGPEGETFPAAGAPRVDDEISKIKQDLDALAQVVTQQKTAYDAHVHMYVNTAGAPTPTTTTLLSVPPGQPFPPAPTAHTPESVACDQVEIY